MSHGDYMRAASNEPSRLRDEDPMVTSHSVQNPAKNEASAVELLECWRHGDEEAAAELFSRYAQRLHGIVSNQLTATLRPRIAPDDVVQSAFASLFLQSRKRRFHFSRDTDLWKLLVTIALNKVRRQVRFHWCAKRDIRREMPHTSECFHTEFGRQAYSSPDDPDQHGLLDDLRRRLGPREQRLIELMVEDMSATQAELGKRLGVADRTIRRMNQRIQRQAREVYGAWS